MFKKQVIYKIIIRFLIFFHNFFYRCIGILACRLEGGIHPKHRLMNYHAFFIDNVNSGESVLDIGCGNGYLTYEIAGKAKRVTAVDINGKNIDEAKRKFSRDNIEYINMDATAISLDRKFDVITMSNVLEHIEDRQDFLTRIAPLADRFLFRVPMINRSWLACYKKELGCSYFLDPTHKVEYTLEEFKEELEKTGLKLKQASVQFGEIWAMADKNA